MKITKLSYAGLAAVLMLMVAGCGEKPEASAATNSPEASAVVSGAGTNEVDSVETDNPAATASPEPTVGTDNAAPTATSEQKKELQSIDVYYTDPQMLDLVKAKADISFSDSVPASKYEEAFQALQTSENTDLVPLWGKIELKSVNFENGQIILDIHKPEEAQLGAGGEAFALSALAKTFFQFEEVKSIEVLVDGEKVESLMGHADLEHPMTRENSITQE